MLRIDVAHAWQQYRSLVFASCLLLPAIGLWSSQVLRSAWCNDESAHIPAGVCHVLTGHMDAYRVNPPLPRILAALPLLFDTPQVDWAYSRSPYERVEYEFASEWLNDSPSTVRRQLLLARVPMIIFYLVGLSAIVCWTREMYGASSAWLAGAMWLFSPDVLTYSATVVPDLPAAAMGVLVSYRYWAWLVSDPRRFPWDVAVCLALAILCKFTWLFLLVLLPMTTLAYDIHRLWRTDRSRSRDTLRLVGSFVIVCILINWCYGFDGTGTRLGNYKFISSVFAGGAMSAEETGNRFQGTVLAMIPIPLPKEMVSGIDHLKWEFEQGLPSYLNGKWQSRGWWYFYLYAVLVKMPLGYWLLFVLGLVTWVSDMVYRNVKYRSEWLPLLVAVALMATVSSQAGFTHHVRYVLPIYGFLFVVASRVAVAFSLRVALTCSAIGLAGTLVFHCTHLGMSHTFFNQLAGGPNEGWRHLGSSNVDWGQSTYRMLDWIKANPQFRPLAVRFSATPADSMRLVAGIENVWIDGLPAPVSPSRIDGYFLVLSSSEMTFEQYGFLRDRETFARPYADVLVYRIEN